MFTCLLACSCCWVSSVMCRLEDLKAGSDCLFVIVASKVEFALLWRRLAVYERCGTLTINSKRQNKKNFTLLLTFTRQILLVATQLLLLVVGVQLGLLLSECLHLGLKGAEDSLLRYLYPPLASRFMHRCHSWGNRVHSPTVKSVICDAGSVH